MAIYGGPDIVTDGLVLYWDIANPKSYLQGASFIYDLSGNSNTGTVTNSTITYSSNFGGVVQFNATSSSRISIASNNFDKRTGTYTVIAASRYFGDTRQRIITSFNNWLLGHWAGGATNYWCEGGIRLISNSPNDTNWRIYAGTGNSTSDIWNFYINGSFLVGNNGGSQGPFGLQIGGLSSENSNGQFSFLQFYNRELSATEIQQNYNALKGRFDL
jgi:hypothetical protein